MSICFDCQNAYPSKCSWIADLIPVEGWTAKPTKIKQKVNSKITYFSDSYKVRKCPKFIADSTENLVSEKKCKHCGKAISENTNQQYCSDECRKTYHRARQTRYYHEKVKEKRCKPKVKKTCVCGVEFETSRKQDFCSKKCRLSEAKKRGVKV